LRAFGAVPIAHSIQLSLKLKIFFKKIKKIKIKIMRELEYWNIESND